MRIHLQNALNICSAFLCPIFLCGTDGVCAGQELKTGGDAPVTENAAFYGDFQPVLKGPGQLEQDMLTAEYLFLQGRVFEAEKRERQAIQCYERACQYVSSDAVLISLVSLAVKQKRYEEAFRYFDKISDPSLLGIPVLDRLATCAARLDKNERVAQTYRAILDSIPVNEAGPMRMLIHDRLGWAEYQAGELDRALTSLRAVHMMLKEPQRFGIREEEQVLFEHSREINLLLLLDICIAKELADEAEEILSELTQWFEKKLAAEELSEEEAQAQRREWEPQCLFESARIAYVRKDAERALKLMLDAYEAGYEEEVPYSLLDAVLQTLGREEETLEILEKILKKQPNRTALKARIAQEYARIAADSGTGTSKTGKKAAAKDAKERAFALYRELCGQNLERYALDQMALALKLGEVGHFEEAFQKLMKSSEAVFGPELLLEDLCGVILEEKERASAKTEKKESTESESTESESTESENAESENAESENAESENAESENAESVDPAAPASVSEDDVKSFLQEEAFTAFAEQLFAASKKAEDRAEAEGKNVRSSQELQWARYGFLAVTAHRMERPELALEFCSQAMNAFKRTKLTNRNRENIVQFMLDVGDILAEEEKFELAEEFYRTVQSRIPGEIRFSIAYCHVLMALGRFADAEKKIQILLEREPDNLEFIFLRADQLQQTQKYEEARTLLRDLLKELQDDYSAEFNRRAVSMIRNMTAVIEERLGNMDAAEELMRSVLDEFPDDASAMNSLAYFWACEDRRLDRALQYSRESLKAEPGNPMYLDTLGWIYYRLGEFELAYETLKEAAEGLEDPVVFSHLGDTALALKQKDEAIRYFKKAQEQFKEAQQKNQDMDPRDLEHVESQLKILKNS
ncbi:MAG: tetratricopeptide repeat protein [Thermoguttaceae bacterium]|nr:tetratricopeptide repeat protein [Thermoguttaceae bacterium]